MDGARKKVQKQHLHVQLVEQRIFDFDGKTKKKRPIIKRFSKGFSPCHSIRTAHLLPYRNESMQSQMKVRGVKTHPLLLVHLEINPFGITFNWKWPNIGKKL